MNTSRQRNHIHHLSVKAYLGNDASLVMTPRTRPSIPKKGDTPPRAPSYQSWNLSKVLLRVLKFIFNCLKLALRSSAIALALFDAASHSCAILRPLIPSSHLQDDWLGLSICESTSPRLARGVQNPIIGVYRTAVQAVTVQSDRYSRLAPAPDSISDGALHKAKVRLLFPLTTLSTPTSDKWQLRSPFHLEPPKEFDQRSALDIFADPPVIGECWKFPGSQAHVGMIMRKPSSIAAITLAYPPEQLSQSDTTRAPKDFQVWGRPFDVHSRRMLCEDSTQKARAMGDFITSTGLPPSIQTDDCLVRLIRAQYEPSLSGIRQLFPVATPQVMYDVIILDVLSNWGSELPIHFIPGNRDAAEYTLGSRAPNAYGNVT